jgi:hypothetical protein
LNRSPSGNARRWVAVIAVLLPAAALVAIILAALPSHHGPPAAPTIPAGALRVNVGTAPTGRPIGTGFVGLSLEYSAIPAYAGTDPTAVNPLLVQLLRNLAPGQSPVLRLGGDSTDRTWYPVPGITPVPGIRYTLTPQWMAVMKALTQTLHARLVLGLNMEANSASIAGGEASAFVSGIGRGPIRAFELGNEPELYGSFPWYQSPPGHGVRGRPEGYGPADYTQEVTSLAPSLPAIQLAGPATGAPKWFPYLRQFAAAVGQVKLITLHRYGTRGCFVGPHSPQYHTIANLISAANTRGLADGIAPYMSLPVRTRIDELGSVNCGGYAGVSDTFAAALWSIDTMFELARVGASGVNFHTFPGAKYEPFAFTDKNGSWSASVKPGYYGMQLFAQAAVPGSRLLPGSGSAGHGVNVWALRAPDGTRRVVAINYGTSGAQTVAVRVAGAGSGSVVQLAAPSLQATSGVTLGGQSYGTATATGKLAAARSASLAPVHGTYVIRLPRAGAALLTLPR